MSRLNFMADHEDAMVTIEEDLRLLERVIDQGYSLTQDEKLTLQDWSKRIQGLLSSTGAWGTDNEPMPDWLTPQTTTQDANDNKKAAIG